MKNISFLILSFILFSAVSFSKNKKETSKETKDTIFTSSTFSGLKLRSIGPAYKSGRIADIVIHPDNPNIWYVAIGSGGVWKTENAGTTWKPIFDSQPVYSIGCITIDPNNHHTLWVGTGENVGGRHVGWGDGIYRSTDDGKTWKNMGLKHSEHISKIIVHPKNPNIIWVAAQGPLWSKGGDRGLFKSTDGGKTWKKTLGDNEWTGVTDIAIDPRNPDRLYAATWQRGRNIAAYMGGGPGTALYRSENGGDTWLKLTNGLPKATMGKIGLAISPQKPDVLYAAIELERRKGAVYRSSNRGASWTKMSNAVSRATGPHYYQELYASPHKFDRIYLADVRMQVSDDGGKTFKVMPEKDKHSDNHTLAFRKDNPNYLLVGCDGGIYESFDLARNWRFVNNLPVTQFYFIAVDDTKPFYNIYGGTQDNNTQGGPSQTDNAAGITNGDWFITMGADGSQPAVEPGNPNIVYSQGQEGFLNRIDIKTGEILFIQPQPGKDEGFERYNWNAPILISPHSPTRIYFASQRVWRSDDRGNSWKPISGDLTKDQERLELPIMDKTWSWDSPWDVYAMSTYNTITALAESPLKEGLIYAGTDDGRLQVTEDGGKNWTKIDANTIHGVPATAYVNDIKADLFDENIVYVALDNHKSGDLKPYLYKSTDKGKSWTSLKGNLPDTTIVWRVVQDHKKPELLFAATEFGMYFTVNGGRKWTKLTGGLPTIAFRDVVVQKDEDDLVCASFGRSIYILDDYSVLRKISEEALKQEALFDAAREAKWYIPRINSRQDQGANFYKAPNPPFGEMFTYYLANDCKTLKEIRQAKEKKLEKEGKPVTFPRWDEAEKEINQQKPAVVITIKDSNGDVARRITGPAKKGFHRIAWDLRYAFPQVLDDCKKTKKGQGQRRRGLLVIPGTYTATLSKVADGKVTQLSGPVSFDVVPLREGTLKGPDMEEKAKFWKEIETTVKDANVLAQKVNKALIKTENILQALNASAEAPGKPESDLHEIRSGLLELQKRMYGSKARKEVGEKNPPTLYSRIGVLMMGTGNSTYGPTPLLRQTLKIANDELKELNARFTPINEKLGSLKEQIEKAGIVILE